MSEKYTTDNELNNDQTGARRMELKKTPLNAIHHELKAKLVDFGGWEMPIQYTSVIDEHHHVRNLCGIFDVSHMGEIMVQGSDSCNLLQHLTINDISRLAVGQGQYTAMLNHKGGMIDDLIIYRVDNLSFLLCVNASNINKDFSWIQKVSTEYSNIQVSNDSSAWSQIAIQGPKSRDVLQSITSKSEWPQIESLDYMSIYESSFCGDKAFIARTGYTGEVGFEIYLSNNAAPSIYHKCLDHNASLPIGLGARDTLRLEAGYLLYGNDMNEEVTPIEAGISWATKLGLKPSFIGEEAVVNHKNPETNRRKMVAFSLLDKGIARSGMKVFLGEEQIGTVTSGSHLPSVGVPGGLALVSKDAVSVGQEVEIDIRGKRKLAQICKRPLYSSNVR